MSSNYINYGMGIVCFPNSIKVDQDLIIPYLSALKQKVIREDYTIVEEDNGIPYAVNRSGHKYNIRDIEISASHIMNFINEQSPKELAIFFANCEKVMYQKLLEYIELFPMILRNIWWKTLGHVLAYSPGSDMGIHNDNDVNYQFKEEPDLQLATRNVVGSIIYLNSSVSTKEDIKKYEYNNGEIYFPYADVKYTPKSGDLLMFPSNYLGTHQIQKCINGHRYAYIGYFAQGSSHPERGINIIEEELPAGSQGQIWMKNLREDYLNYIIKKYDISNSNQKFFDPKIQELLKPTELRLSSSGTRKNLPNKIDYDQK